jgi:carnitine-CoA ligase
VTLTENRLDLTLPGFLSDTVRKHPQKNFIEFENRALTYQEVDSLSDQFAKFLKESGVTKGDRVAVKLANSPEFIVAWFASAKLGAVTVPINYQYKESETNQILGHCLPKIVLSTKDLFSTSPPPESRVVWMDEDSMEGMTKGGASYESPKLDPSDPLVIIYTSGTTGSPKGVVQSHSTFVITGLSFPMWLGLTDEDRLLTCLPLSHINAQAYSTMGVIGSGATLILQQKFSLSSFWDKVRDSRATEFNAVGAMLMLMYKHTTQPRRDHYVRIAYSAPSLPEEIRNEIERRFNLRVVFGYALSESTFGFIEPISGVRKQGSMGKIRSHPQFPNRAIIADTDDAEVPIGTTGQILLQNAAVMNGYYRDGKRTAETMKNGFLHTGDLAYRDSDGYFFFVDRSSDVVRSKGENISSSEIESVIISNPEVTECAIVGMPSELSDDDIIAFVVVKSGSGINENEIKQWCRERLASFKVPAKILFKESLPKGPTFRTDKKQLKGEAMNLPARRELLGDNN